MSNTMRFEYALQEPAMAIAPVFVALQKGPRKKLDVTFKFGGATLQWRGPDALGMLEQSVLLGMVAMAGQQKFRLSLSQQSDAGRSLISGLALNGAFPMTDLVVLKASWKKLAAATGYKNTGGQNVRLTKAAVKRLAETTIWENCEGKEYQSRILSWMEGDKEGVTIALNCRATDALCGGQHVKISLSERHMLPDDSTKALHAWLSAHTRPGSKRIYIIAKLQTHVWQGAASNSTLRTRLGKLHAALLAIGELPAWRCQFSSAGTVEIQRISSRSALGKVGTIAAQ
jgi:hypothetical protein